MKHLEPNIILIDDHREEIEDILFYYQNKGIGCKLYNPDYAEGDEMPDRPYSDVSIIFLDLYYSGKFDAELCGDWVRSMVYEKSFYILILWSKDTSKAEEVLQQLKTHNKSPFIELIKSKTNFQGKDGKKYDFSSLIEEINKNLDSISALEEIQIWKNCMKSSSNIVLGNIVKDAHHINNKLKKIIIGHGGTSLRAENDDNVKRSTLFDALDTVLISNTKGNLDCKISEVNSQTLYNLEEVEPINTDKELNSWFHFKLNQSLPKDTIIPGLIAYNNHSLFKKIYSIKDDDKIEPLLKKQFEAGIDIKDIVLLISRPCDIAQKKYGKNLKLLSGLMLFNPIRKGNGKFDFNGTPIESLKLYDHLYLNSENTDIALIFDYRYSFSVPQDIFKSKFEKSRIFNKELLSEIQVEYSSYSSRLGITQII